MANLARLPVLRDLDVAATGLLTLAGSGALRPVRPDRLVGMGMAAARWGVSPGTAYAAAAVRDPHGIAVVDDDTTLTFRDVDRRSNAVARGLQRLGVGRGDVVALLARNSAAFVVAQAAATKAGADLVYLNTGFAGPQLGDVLDRENVTAVVADGEFADAVAGAARGVPLVVIGGDTLPDDAVAFDELAGGDCRATGFAPIPGRHVILTSGTTGTPKGAPRSAPGGLGAFEPIAAVLSAIPLRARETTVLAAPMFHAWGFLHLSLAQLLGSTIVVSRRFDPERALALVEEHRATALVAVPVMAQRIVELPERRRRRHDTSSLRILALSGSALPPPLARRLTEELGDVVYDLYGSTEVAYAAIATPRDLREAPGSVGRPVRGVTVRIVDEDGNDVPRGTSGRIFVGSRLAFGGYTGGGDKDRLGPCVATGDVGRIDADGRLWIEGRADDMIVSGGENVFPAEVEECLLNHPAVADAAVVGVPDDAFGQRLVAHVVTNREVDPEDLRRHVKANLANYKVPREVVLHDELPRNETGKVLKRELRDG